MDLNDMEKMKEIILRSDDYFSLEIRRASFHKLVTVALQSDNLTLFDWLQSKQIPSEVKISIKFSVKTILDAVTFRSNNIILSALMNFQIFQISNISQIKNANGQNIFHLSALSHNNSLITSILMNLELPIRIKDSLAVGMKGLDVCDNTIFHSALMAENVHFIDAIYNYILPFNLYGTPEYALGFHHFSDEILLHRNFSKQSVYDLLQQLRDKSKSEALTCAITSLSQLLFNLNHISEVRSYFASEYPNYDMPSAIFIELMSKISYNTKTALQDMKQILGNDVSNIKSSDYFPYSVRMGYRKTVTYLMNFDKSNNQGTIKKEDVCGLYWKVDKCRCHRQSEFCKWDAVVQEAACCSYGKRSFWDDFFPSYDIARNESIVDYQKFDHYNESSNVEMARWLFLYSKKVALPVINYFIGDSTCDKIIAKSFLSHRLWLNNIMSRIASRDLMPIISSYLFPKLETSDSMLMKVTGQTVTLTPATAFAGFTSNGMVEKTEYLARWLVTEARADPYLKLVSQLCGGQTALHLAVASNQILTVKWLVSFDSQLLFRECQANSMLPINYAISLSSDTEDDQQDRTCIAVFLASVMADLLAPYSTHQYAVVGQYLDSRGRSIASFASSCKAARVRVVFCNDNAPEVNEPDKGQLSISQNKAYAVLCDKMLSNQSLQDIVRACTDNGWMYYFQANKLEEVGSAAEHQFLHRAVLAQRCDVLDWYCSQVEGLLFPWLWDFNADTSMWQPGLLHTTYYVEEDLADTSSSDHLYSTVNHRGCSIRSLATALRLDSILDWIETCKSIEKVEACRSKKWFETTLLTYEGYHTSKLGFRGALKSGASVHTLRSLLTRGNQAIAAHRSSLKYESNKINFDNMISVGIRVEEAHSSSYSPVFVANASKMYGLPDDNGVYKQAFHQGHVHVIEWLVNLMPEYYSDLRAMIAVLEGVAVRLNRLSILNAIRKSKHKRCIHSIADILQMAATYSEFEIFCHFYESIEVESEGPSTDDVLSFLLNIKKLETNWSYDLFHWYCRGFTSNKESEKEATVRKQRNSVKILKYIIAKSNVWPKAGSRNVLRLFSDHKSQAASTSLRVPLELCVFLMEEIGFELCRIIPLDLLEDFPVLLQLYNKSIYEVKVADMITTGATVAELVAFTEVHRIIPQAIRGVDGMPMTHLAAKHNRRHILEWLVEKGSDALATDRKGNSALQVATHFKSSDVLAFLVPVVLPVRDSSTGVVSAGVADSYQDYSHIHPLQNESITADNVINSNTVGSQRSSISSDSHTEVLPPPPTAAIDGCRFDTASVVSNESGISQPHSDFHPSQNMSIEPVYQNGSNISDINSEIKSPLPSAATEASTDDDWECVTSRKQRKLIIRSEKIKVKVSVESKVTTKAAPKNSTGIPKERFGICDVAAVIEQTSDCHPLENESKNTDKVNKTVTIEGQSDTSGSKPLSVAMSSLPPAATEASTDDGWECVTSRRQRLRLTRSKK